MKVREFLYWLGLILILIFFTEITCNAQNPTQPLIPFGSKGLGIDYFDPSYTGGLGITVTLSNNYLTIQNIGGHFVSLTKLPMTTDSIYVEFYINPSDVTITYDSCFADIGIAIYGAILSGTSATLGQDTSGWGYLNNPNAPDFSSFKYHSASLGSYGLLCRKLDTVMVGFNGTSHKVWSGLNGTWFNSGNPSLGTNPMYSGLSASSYHFAVSNFNGNKGKYTYNPNATTYKPAGWHNPHF